MSGSNPHTTGPTRLPRGPAVLLLAVVVALLVAGGPWGSFVARTPGVSGAGWDQLRPLTPGLGPSEALPGDAGGFSVSLSASPSTVAAGSSLLVTLQISPLDGAPFNLSWSGLPNPCGGVAPSSVSSSPSSFSCDPSQTGTYSPNVEATNVTGVTQGASTSVTVYAPLQVALSASSSSVTVPHAITFDYQVSGGVSPYQLEWGNLPSGCSQDAPTSLDNNNPASFSCSPSQATQSGGEVNLQVMDSAIPSNTRSASTPLTVYAALQAMLSLSTQSVSVGSSVTINYQVNGGQSPYRLQWSGLPDSCAGSAPGSVSDSNPDNFPCSPGQAGNMQIGLQVTDSASPSNSASAASQSLTVTSNGNNNNNNNGNSKNSSGGNGGNGNNSSLSSLFSHLGSLLIIAEIVGITVFALLVITAVSTLVTAVIVSRRLPKRSAGAGPGPTVACPSCGAAAPPSSKFCPECGRPMASGKPS